MLFRSLLIEFDELVFDQVGLGGDGLVAPWQCGEGPVKVLHEDRGYVRARSRVVPQSEGFGRRGVQSRPVAVDFTVRGRASVTPAAVRKADAC